MWKGNAPFRFAFISCCCFVYCLFVTVAFCLCCIQLHKLSRSLVQPGRANFRANSPTKRRARKRESWIRGKLETDPLVAPAFIIIRVQSALVTTSIEQLEEQYCFCSRLLALLWPLGVSLCLVRRLDTATHLNMSLKIHRPNGCAQLARSVDRGKWPSRARFRLVPLNLASYPSSSFAISSSSRGPDSRSRADTRLRASGRQPNGQLGGPRDERLAGCAIIVSPEPPAQSTQRMTSNERDNKRTISERPLTCDSRPGRVSLIATHY